MRHGERARPRARRGRGEEEERVGERPVETDLLAGDVDARETEAAVRSPTTTRFGGSRVRALIRCPAATALRPRRSRSTASARMIGSTRPRLLVDSATEGLAAGRYQIVHGAADQAVALAASVDTIVVAGGDDGFNRLFVQPDSRALSISRTDPGRRHHQHRLVVRALRILRRTASNAATIPCTRPAHHSAASKPCGRIARWPQQSSTRPSRSTPAGLGLKYMGAGGGHHRPAIRGRCRMCCAPGRRHTPISLVAYLAAVIDGLRWSRDPVNASEAVSLYRDRLNVPPDIAAEIYAVAIRSGAWPCVRCRPRPGGFRDHAEASRHIRRPALAPAERYFDLSYHRRALATLCEHVHRVTARMDLAAGPDTLQQ